MLFRMSGPLPYAVIYLLGFLTLTWLTRKSISQFVIISSSIVGILLFIVTRVDYMNTKLLSFLNLGDQQSDQATQTLDAIRSAGWTGHGFTAANDMLPYVYSDSIFPYLIYCFGWGFGIFIVLLFLMFITRVLDMTRALKDDYAKHVSMGLLAIFGFRLMLPVLMAFGIVPIIGIDLPFIAYGGMTQVFDFAAAGILLSLYRRKDMVPYEAQQSSAI